MTYSSLISGSTDLTAKSNPRTSGIRKITLHHMACVMSGKACAEMHKGSAVQASANYYVGNDGQIWGGVPEECRAWTSSNAENDHQAITVEVSNSSTGGDWPISAAAIDSVIKLCKDICNRYGITLIWTGSASGTLTCHDMFAATTCPGPYFKAKFPEIVAKVNTADPVVPVKKPDPIAKGPENSVYRLYNPNNGDHFYTTSHSEAQKCQDSGWTYEGIAWTAPKEGAEVKRLYNKSSGQHLYTSSAGEVATLVKAGWTDEGVAFRSAGTKPIYRMYHAGHHIYTASHAEHDALHKAGWDCENQDIKY